ncbi:hypothetical protein AB0D09_30525 [Streptomyces sp. NPDC049097]|uniref:hypothetical protein n=1 Tax=unclassified Streptomyces TaxID=2593676 RepID=UPI0033A22924
MASLRGRVLVRIEAKACRESARTSRSPRARIEPVGHVHYGRVLVRPRRRTVRQRLLRESAAHASRTG